MPCLVVQNPPANRGKRVEIPTDRESVTFKRLGVVIDRRPGGHVLRHGPPNDEVWVDGEHLRPGAALSLRDGSTIRVGDVELLFLDEAERGEVKDRPLADWWQRGADAPATLPVEALKAVLDLCG